MTDMHNEQIRATQEKLAKLIAGEFERIERMKQSDQATDFSALDKIVIGVIPGDGIGPIIMEQALRVIRELMKEEIESGKIEIRKIEGMTIERRAELEQSLPEDVLEARSEEHTV